MSRRSDHGFVTLWVLGLAMVLLFVGGLALDLWRAFSERRAIAAMADAAAVAGASGIDEGAFRRDGTVVLDPGRAEALAYRNLDAQSDRRSLTGAVAVARPESVTVTARGEVAFTLLRVFMRGEPLAISVTATADPRASP